MTIPVPSIPLALKTLGVAVWGLYAFGSDFHSHIGADTSFGGSFLLGLALWGAGTVYPEWFKPSTNV